MTLSHCGGQALARACTPSATAQPPSLQQPLLEAVDGAVEELGRLLEAEDMQEAGCSDAGDASILRLATASALLRLCRLHDARVPPDTFMMLSLSMQVRAHERACGQKLCWPAFCWSVASDLLAKQLNEIPQKDNSFLEDIMGAGASCQDVTHWLPIV